MLLLSGLVSAIAVYIPTLNRKIIDQGITEGNLRLVVTLCVLLFAMYLVSSILKFANNGLVSGLGTRVISEAKKNLIGRIFRFPLPFFDSKSSGELTQRVHEVDQLTVFFSPTFLHIFTGLISSIGGLVVVLRIEPSLLLFYLPAIPILGFLSYTLARKIQGSLMKTAEMASHSSGMVQESIQGIAEIKSLDLSDNKEKQIHEINSSIYKNTLWQNLFIAGGNEIIGLLNILLSLGITVLCASTIINRNMTLGEYVAITQYTSIIIAPAQLVASAYISLQPGVVALKRMRNISGEYEEENDDGELFPEEVVTIEMEQMNFRYNKDTEVLHDISFTVNKGEKLVITGPNGSGKTTIAKLLMGLYPEYEGAIKYNGLNMKDYSMRSIRKQISIVFQEVFLFNGTLEQNIQYAAPEASRMEIIEVLRKSGFLSGVSEEEMLIYLSMPILEGGKNLSGGQKRRIALARALARRPKVLILDEATAHLDQETREMLKQWLLEPIEDMICIIITHDADLAQLADVSLQLGGRSDASLASEAKAVPATCSHNC